MVFRTPIGFTEYKVVGRALPYPTAGSPQIEMGALRDRVPRTMIVVKIAKVPTCASVTPCSTPSRTLRAAYAVAPKGG